LIAIAFLKFFLEGMLAYNCAAFRNEGIDFGERFLQKTLFIWRVKKSDIKNFISH
jgi:hypothetical protein